MKGFVARYDKVLILLQGADHKVKQDCLIHSLLSIECNETKVTMNNLQPFRYQTIPKVWGIASIQPQKQAQFNGT